MSHPPNAPASARPDPRCRDSDRYMYLLYKNIIIKRLNDKLDFKNLDFLLLYIKFQSIIINYRYLRQYKFTLSFISFYSNLYQN